MKPRFKTPRIVATRSEWESLKRRVYERDNWRCRICGTAYHLTPDHIIKRSQGGDDLEANLWTLCAFCHNRKDEYRLTPEEAVKIPKGTKYGKPCSFHYVPV